MSRPIRDIGDANISWLAELLADPSRAKIVLTLSDGRAQVAGVLARAAGLTPSAASAHLGRLVHGGILTVERRGRYRWYRIASAGVISVVETMAAFTGPVRAQSLREAHAGRALRVARLCYDHLAGALGVAITESLVADGSLVRADNGFSVAPSGAARFKALGVNLDEVSAAARRTRRPLARACLDWTEKRPHLAGALGAALASKILEADWLTRMPHARAVKITNTGRRALRREFGIDAW